MFVVLFNHYRLSYEFFVFAIFISSLIIVTFVDIKHRIIPDEVSIGGIILGFILNSVRGFNVKPFTYNTKPMLNSFLGIIIGAGIIYLTRFLFDLVYFKILKKPPVQGETSSMGDGDIILLAMIGAFLGWKAAILTFFIAPFLGILAGAANLIVKKEHVIPYGPFLSLAALVSLFWLDKIIHFFFIR
jgi:leader peptidase (prepilin peptidase)/N-methyltransferase